MREKKGWSTGKKIGLGILGFFILFIFIGAITTFLEEGVGTPNYIRFDTYKQDESLTAYFRLEDIEYRDVASDGKVTIKITDERNRVIYEDNFTVRKQDFSRLTRTFTGEEFLGYLWHIPFSDMEKGVGRGVAEFTFLASDGSFWVYEDTDVSIPELTELPEKILTIGETAIAEIGDLTVKVISAEGTTSYTDEDGDVQLAPSGKIFVITDVEVKYIGTDSESVSYSDFWLVDSIWDKYEYTSGTYHLVDGFESVTLYPNQTTRGKILFEVPDYVKNLKIQCDIGTYKTKELVSWELELVAIPKVLNPIADAHVEPGYKGKYADSNFGGEDSLDLDSTYYRIDYTRKMAGSTKVYIKFDLTAIPSGATINSAELKLYTYGPSETIDVSVYYCSNDTWTESGITWNNSPSYESTATGTTNITGSGWYSWTVTQDVRRAISKGKLSLVLKMDLEGIVEYRSIYVNFYSRESYKPPRLEISYTS